MKRKPKAIDDGHPLLWRDRGEKLTGYDLHLAQYEKSKQHMFYALFESGWSDEKVSKIVMDHNVKYFHMDDY